MIGWGLSDLARAWRRARVLYAAAAAPLIAVLALLAWQQTSHWQNSLTLWEHCVACQPETNDFAQNMYGVALADAGHVNEAMEHYAKAVEINPKYLTPRTNYAVNLQKQGKSREALNVCDAALEVDPDDVQTHFIRAVALYGISEAEKDPAIRKSRVEDSIREFRLVTEMKPGHVLAHNNLAEVLRLNKRSDEALAECRTALELNPELPEGHRTMANILVAKSDLDGALEEFQTALKFKPDDLPAHDGLVNVLRQRGRFREAAEHRRQQLAGLQPQNAAVAVKVVRELIGDPRPEARFGAEAVEIARRACEVTEYKDIFALDALAAACAEAGDFAQAEEAIRKAMATPLGQTPNNSAELQKRLLLYQARQKPRVPGS